VETGNQSIDGPTFYQLRIGLFELHQQ